MKTKRAAREHGKT